MFVYLKCEHRWHHNTNLLKNMHYFMQIPYSVNISLAYILNVKKSF